MSVTSAIDWASLESLAGQLAAPGFGPGSVLEAEWQIVEDALETLLARQDWSGIIRLRRIFGDLFARDTVGGLPLLQQLDDKAIEVARRISDRAILAHLLGARGHNLHRQGYHQEAIECFEEAADLYLAVGESFESLKNFYMTSLCHRALGNREHAKNVLERVLQQVESDDPWRGNPLHVMAWLVQDEGDLAETEHLLREALSLHAQTKDPDILVAGALADLGEVMGLQGDTDEAQRLFHQSLAILGQYGGQYNRQEARTSLKLAELLMRQRAYDEALCLLNQADDLVRGYGHYYDLMWRIELARSFIYLRQGRFRSAARKFQAALRFRQELGLPTTMLVRQLISRLLAGTGLPR
ncbi:MAG: tetratricopeptide repeat protein [Nitrososphaera sp.]|nr:tetratricopeptide repeat protein [Nitrososphaera sp.]